tara:strand:+ start:115 stop:267 length:153 start_codon:yes stop_codon:yes gene_type:complete
MAFVALIDALRFTILEFDNEDPRHSGQICALLGEQGTPIGLVQFQTQASV